MKRLAVQGLALVVIILAATDAFAQTVPPTAPPVPAGRVPLETYAALDAATARKLLEFERRIDTFERVCCEGKTTDCPPGCKAAVDRCRGHISDTKRRAELLKKEAFDAACAKIEAELSEIARQLGVIQVSIEELPERIRPVIAEEVDRRVDQLEEKYGQAWLDGARRFCGQYVSLYEGARTDEDRAAGLELIDKCLDQVGTLTEAGTVDACEENGCTFKGDGFFLHVRRPREKKGMGYLECFLIGTGASVAVGGGTWLGTYLADCDPAFQATLAGSLAAGGAVISALACIPAAR